MTDVILPPAKQFLRDHAVRGGMDLLFFAHRSHLQRADEELERLGLGRAHHRVLYCLSRRPGMTVGELLAVLAITKQSIGRVLKQLLAQDLVERRPGVQDRRQRHLFLTTNGEALEHSLFADLRANMARAYTSAGEEAVAGYWIVMQHLMTQDVQDQFLAFQSASR